MSEKRRAWVATPTETKIAWSIASICIVLIIASFFWPLFDTPYDNRTSTAPAQKPETTTTGKTETIEKIIAQSQKHPTSQIKIKPELTEVSKPISTTKKTPPVTVKKKPSDPQSATEKTLPHGYYVQVGAFKEPKRAHTLQKKLAQHWKTHTKNKAGNITAVWVGPYATSKAASQTKTAIATRTKIKGFIVRQ